MPHVGGCFPGRGHYLTQSSWRLHAVTSSQHPGNLTGSTCVIQPRGKAERKPTSREARQKGSLPAERQGRKEAYQPRDEEVCEAVDGGRV